ncbi:MAG: phospholipase/Carboxylesterase [Solirubrobacterales bacterium]|nr:phospholipase/Carboxylesterase [Solirubrobacterales bacterium]
MTDSLDYELRPAAGDPAGALVLFHGRGVDEQDLLPVLDVLDPRRRLVGATPRGPLQLPPGGRHWYIVPRVGFPEPQTFFDSLARASTFLDELAERTGVPLSRTVLGGFSQGTVMAYALALGAGRPKPAGLVAMSGFIPTVEGFSLDLEGRRDLPVAIAHGSRDPIISVDFARDARDRLRAAGLEPLYLESPMPHAIDPRSLPDLERFVADAVDRAAASGTS